MRIPMTLFHRAGIFACVAAIVTVGTALAEPVKRADLIVRGEFVVTIDAARPVIEDGAVAVKNGDIVAVGPADEVLAAYRSSTVIDGEDRVLMPGLVNGHTHAAMTLFRGIADDLELIEWLTEFIFPAEAEFVDEEFVRVGTQLACWEMIRGGTTTFVDMYFFPDVVAQVVDQCGLRAIVTPTAIDFPSPGHGGWDDSFASAVSFATRWKNRHRRITPGIAPHAPYTVAPEHLVEAFEAAQQLQVPIHIHLAETLAEVDDILARYGNRPVNHMDATGVLEPRLIAAHMVWPDDQEIALLAERGIGVVHNPVSNMKLASGLSPVPRMLDAGVKVGLGTDGAASNNDLDMWEEINLASLVHKGAALDPTIMPAETVLRMATLGGAEAVSLDDEVGALTVGRRADLIQLRLDGPHLTPMYNVISHLVYAADSSDVVTVIVDGNVLMSEGAVLTVDGETVRSQARAIAREIADSLEPLP